MQKRNSQRLPNAVKYIIAVGISAIVALFLSLITSAVLLASEDPTRHTSLYGEIIFCISMLLSALFGAKFSSSQKFLGGTVSSALLLLLVIAASFCFSGKAENGIAVAAAGVVCGIVGAFLGAREPKRKRRKTH